MYDFAKMCEHLDAYINNIVTGIEKSNDIEITLQEQQIISAYRELFDSDKRIVDFVLVTSENNMSKAILKLQIFKGFLKSFPHNVPSTIILH